jgi:septal ring factor EnvC (AmiA/AmiB activator)
MNQLKDPQRQGQQGRLHAVALRIIDWIGSIQSLIVHTIVFAGSFALILIGFDSGTVLLVLTTLVSLEAIYMAIFIQMALNQASQSIAAVEEDIDEIQEDVEEIQEDVEEIEKDVGEIEKDIDEIQKDVDEIEKDIDVIEQEIPEEGIGNQGKEQLEQVELRLVKLLAQLEKMKDTGK